MKRTLKYALTAALATMMAVPALAQDNFPDVPDNHWAYEALLRLKSNGLLVGYPDGLFRGPRPASRYEMAVAIHATYVNLKNITDGLQRQIDELKATTGQGNTGDLSSLRQAIENLQNEVNGMKAWGQSIQDLRRLADTFQKELQDLNVDVEQMKKDLADLNDRVTRLEKIKPAVSISGDANLWVGTGFSVDDNVNGHLDKDGRRAGWINGGSFGRDLTVLHEGALKFSTTNEEGPKFAGTVVFTNMIQPNNPGAVRGGFFNQGQAFPGSSYADNASGDVYIQDFSVKFDGPVSAEIGRLGYKVSPYIYQRPDYTSYFANDRWDNGEWIIDGALVGLGFGGNAKLDVFAGRTAERYSVNRVELQPQPIFGVNADRIVGANLTVPIGERGKINAAYLLHDINTQVAIGPGQNVNRLEVYGVDADFSLFNNFTIGGGFHQSNYKRNDSKVNAGTNDEDRQAWNVGLGYTGGNFGISGEYREIGYGYAALGDWGRLGIFRNPTDIKGFRVKGYLNLSDAITLKAGGEFVEGKELSDGEINSFNVGVDWKLSNTLTVMAGYETTEFKNVVAGAKPRYNWANLGVAYNVNDMAKLMVGLEFSDIKEEFSLQPGLNNYKGGLLTTQLTVKF